MRLRNIGLGNIVLDVTVPSVGAKKRSDQNFLSPGRGRTDFTKAAKRVRDDAEGVQAQLADISGQVADPALLEAQDKLSRASALSPSETSPETTKQAMDDTSKGPKSFWRGPENRIFAYSDALSSTASRSVSITCAA